MLTNAERNRLYCVMEACSACGAKRGEFCISKNGKRWENDSHAGRGSPRRKSLEYKRRYEKIKQQILSQREVVGHE